MLKDTLQEPRMDRRCHARDPITRPCKVLHAGSIHYLAGETRDVSPEGLLVSINSPREIAVGDRVDVLVAWTDRGLLHQRDTRAGRVVRIMEGPGQRQYLGIQLAAERAQRLAA